MKQWRKSSRWRKAYKKASSEEMKSTRFLMRLLRLVRNENPFKFSYTAQIDYECLRLQKAMAEKFLKPSPFLNFFTRQEFPKDIAIL